MEKKEKLRLTAKKSIEIFEAIKDRLSADDEGFYSYADGMTEIQVAREISEMLGYPVSEQNVGNVRLQMFGKMRPFRREDVTTEKIDNLATAIGVKIGGLEERIAKLEGRISDNTSEVLEMLVAVEKRINALERGAKSVELSWREKPETGPEIKFSSPVDEQVHAYLTKFGKSELASIHEAVGGNYWTVAHACQRLAERGLIRKGAKRGEYLSHAA